MTRKTKKTHLGFICMSIPRILCQLNILKAAIFFKKKEKLEWLAMMVMVYSLSVLECLLPGKSWPTSIAKGLPSHIVVKLGRENLQDFVRSVQLSQSFKTGTWGFIWGDGEVEGKSHRMIYQGRVPEKLLTWRWENVMHPFCAKKLRDWGHPEAGQMRYCPSTREEGWLYILVICVCTGAGPSGALRFLIAVKESQLLLVA